MNEIKRNKRGWINLIDRKKSVTLVVCQDNIEISVFIITEEKRSFSNRQNEANLSN